MRVWPVVTSADSSIAASTAWSCSGMQAAMNAPRKVSRNVPISSSVKALESGLGICSSNAARNDFDRLWSELSPYALSSSGSASIDASSAGSTPAASSASSMPATTCGSSVNSCASSDCAAGFASSMSSPKARPSSWATAGSRPPASRRRSASSRSWSSPTPIEVSVSRTSRWTSVWSWRIRASASSSCVSIARKPRRRAVSSFWRSVDISLVKSVVVRAMRIRSSGCSGNLPVTATSNPVRLSVATY